jgi:hypothetical protein
MISAKLLFIELCLAVAFGSVPPYVCLRQWLDRLH